MVVFNIIFRPYVYYYGCGFLSCASFKRHENKSEKLWTEIKYVLDKFAKEAPGLKVEKGSDAGFASAQIPANKDIGFFPLKIDGDCLSFAYELLRAKNCVSLNDSSSEGVVFGDFEDDY